MCRLFGLHAGAIPVSAAFWLLDAPDSLDAQSRQNPDGAGIGVFDANGQVVVDKQPLAAWNDPQFATGAHDLRGTTFVAHVRYASTGALTLANTHPFLQAGRLFAHNGVIGGLPELDAHLFDLGAGDLVRGETDSERVFALITAEAARRDGDVTAAIGAAIGWISANLPVFSVNFVMTTATDLWALRYPDTHELFVLERPAGGHDGQHELHAHSARIRATAPHLDRRPSVVIATERMDDDPGWRALAPGELLHVDRALRLRSDTPLPPTPKHLLRLADLDAAAAKSQHPAP
jgi:predicted glutamine amidotransferase